MHSKFRDMSILKQVSAYSILGVHENATLEEIHQQYQQKIGLLQQESYDLSHETKRIHLSYLILSNPHLRQRYDSKLLQVKLSLIQMTSSNLYDVIKRFIDSQTEDQKEQDTKETTILKCASPINGSPDWTQEFTIPVAPQLQNISYFLTSNKQESEQTNCQLLCNEEIQKCSQLLNQYKNRILRRVIEKRPKRARPLRPSRHSRRLIMKKKYF